MCYTCNKQDHYASFYSEKIKIKDKTAYTTLYIIKDFKYLTI